jgi:nitrogen regulatory protein PII
LKEVTVREIKAVVRKERLAELVRSLQNAGASRFTVSRVHVLGTGVDPTDVQFSFDEGAAYTEKAKVEVLCPKEHVSGLLQAIRQAAATGHRGDGILIVSSVDEVTNIRTGDTGELALL